MKKKQRVFFPVYRVPFSQCHVEMLGSKLECELEGISLDSIQLYSRDRFPNSHTDCFNIYLKEKEYSLKGSRINSDFYLTTKTYHYEYHLNFSEKSKFMDWLNLIKAFHKMSQKKSDYLITIN